MPTMSDKEKKVQIALGTLDIPELIPINLNKVDENNNTHPDIKEGRQYLIHICGEYLIGYIDPDSHTFCVGCYEHDMDDCDTIWLIKGRSS